MKFKNCYDFIMSEVTQKEAEEACYNMVWSEMETNNSNIGYYNHIDTVNGIELYYDYAADYYFFVDATSN